jgi:hypothetical protein
VTHEARTPEIAERALAALAVLLRDARVPDDATFAQLAPVLSRIPPAARTVTLAARFAQRAMQTHGAFSFPQRETPLGCLGFPRALVAIDPYALAESALASDVAQLDAREAELARAFADTPREGPALGVADYARAFDPAFVQFVLLDRARVERALTLPAAQAGGLLRDAVRASLDPTTADALIDAWCAPLERDEPRARERFVRLFAATAHGAPAEEGFWADVAFRGSTGSSGPRVLGVFLIEGTAAVVPGPMPRLYTVDAARARELDASTAAPRGDIVDTARAIRAEVAQLARQAHAGIALAFRRATANELADDGGALKVSEALQRS